MIYKGSIRIYYSSAVREHYPPRADVINFGGNFHPSLGWNYGGPLPLGAAGEHIRL